MTVPAQPAHVVPGQSVSQPEHLLTPRIGAIPHQNPLGLALDQKVLLGRPVPRDMGDVAVAGGEEDQDVNCASSEARSDNAEPPDDDEVGVTDFSDASRSPSPALTVSNGPTSPPSTAGSIPPSISSMSPNPTTMSSTSLPLPGAPLAVPTPGAELGFGSLPSEEELKKALAAKDRMFVLMLGKEFEAFIGRVSRGEHTTRVVPSQASASSSSILLESLGPSKRIDVTATSKYQRMLTYKLAEWYGLRATPGVDAGSMVVGVLGVLDPKSVTLKVSNLVPEASAPRTQFRIMRREAPGDEEGLSRGTSVSGDDGTESSGPRGKTLEERTLAYALARKRIIGDDELRDDDSVSAVSATHSASQPRSRQASRYGDDDDDLDPVPRRYPPDFDFVYPSLYHPSNIGHAPGGQQPYPYAGMQGPSYQGYPPAMGYDGQQGYMGYPNAAQYPGQVPMAGSYSQWQQHMGQGLGQQAMGPGMGQMPMMANQGWYPPDMAPPPNMMPMIPQGMPYTPNFGYQQQLHQSQPPTLVQPTPLRPGLDHLSSTASSTSSRSYQDVHSRPHSRGSTTSTRSAASSVRLGAMYPTAQQAGYGFRQKAVKTQAQGSFSGQRPLPPPEPRRNGRQSPASTASSRSSRRASSIHIQPPLPGQHPLPQRPDWAANNVPYHPSPGVAVEPSTSEFPPLHRGVPVTNAEPMQVEKIKLKPTNGTTVWNGAGSHAVRAVEVAHGIVTPQQSPILSHECVSILPNPMKAAEIPQILPTPLPLAETDPDFPRRVQSTRAPLLFDPSAPVPATTLRHGQGTVTATSSRQASGAQLHVRSTAAADVTPLSPSPPATPSVSADMGEMEARLADLSVGSGSAGGGVLGAARPPSYAKIVRRD